jgi:hypothetical protein
VPLAVVAALAAGAPPAQGANARGFAINNMKQIALGMQNYRDAFGGAPLTDIVDAKGRPFLSWRVRLLPFIEQDHLYRQFRLDEPWDSPHNKALIDQRPPVYSDPWGGKEDGRTHYLRPLGAEPGEGLLNPRICLVEVDDEHAVIWTKPGDLDYDPAKPTAGLTQRWLIDGALRRGGPVMLEDGAFRLVPSTARPEFVRALFSGQPDESARNELTYFQVVFRRPWRGLVLPSLLIALVAIAGGSAIAYRACCGRELSAGEWLWLVLAVSQFTVLLHLLAFYRTVEVVSSWRLGGWGDPRVLWAGPTVAGILCALLAWGRSSPGWRALFGVNVALWALAAWDATIPRYYLPPEQAFVTAGAPFVMGLGSMALMAWTVLRPGRLIPEGRLLWHWLGLAVCLLPLLWFAVCWWDDRVCVFPPFMRVLPVND